MAFTKKHKGLLQKQYEKWLKKSQAIFVLEYTKMGMKAIDGLRGKVRDAGGEIHVVKNTLARIALEQSGRKMPAEFFTKSTAIGFAFSDVPAVAKALTASTKDSDFIKIKGALLGNQVLDAKQVQALAELPPMPVVRAQFLGLLSAPATRLTGVIASGVRQVVNVVKAYGDKAESKPEEAPAAA